VGGGRAFIVLRDQSGLVQLQLTDESIAGYNSLLEDLKNGQEATVSARGRVQCRPLGMWNPMMQTGKWEVLVDEFVILNPATNLPFKPNTTPLPDEDVRLQHRFVDLRRERLQENIRLRAHVNQHIREYFQQRRITHLFKLTSS
jgi:aspartyl-tRNA synthetase